MVIDMNYWSKVVKNVLVFLLSVVIVIFGFKFAIFYMPFLVAFLIATILEPVIKYIMKKTKLKRKASSIIVFIITIGIILGLLTWGIIALIEEVSNILGNYSEYVEDFSGSLEMIMSSIDLEKLDIPENVLNILLDSVGSFLSTITGWLQNALNGIFAFLTSIPNIGISVVITLLALYFMCVDKVYMIDQIEHHLPKTWVKKIDVHQKELMKSLGAFLRAEIILVIISFFISLIGLSIFNLIGWDVPYPLLVALAIGFVDLLPIFGSGTVMLPWAIFLAFKGNISLALAILILWIIMSVVRQIIEPKIVSTQIGIHPIFTLIAMYTGFKFAGVIGLLVGPIILIILKNIYGTIIEKGFVKSIVER